MRRAIQLCFDGVPHIYIDDAEVYDDDRELVVYPITPPREIPGGEAA